MTSDLSNKNNLVSVRILQIFMLGLQPFPVYSQVTNLEGSGIRKLCQSSAGMYHH